MSKVKNVLHLIDTDVLSGPGKTIYNSWKFIDPKKWKILIAVFDNENNQYIDFLKKNDVPVYEIKERFKNFPYQLSYPYVIYQIRKILTSRNVDILHTHHHKADFFGLLAALRINIKVISTHHGFIENTNKAALANKIARWSTSRMDKIIAVSKKMNEHLIGYGMPIEKIQIVHNAIVTNDYIKNDKNQNIIEEYHLKDKSPIIGSVGRISPEKGQKILCEAFLRVLKSFPDACLLLIGDGEEFETLKDKYKEYAKSIIFTGYKKNVKDYISVLDLHVLPSLTEGLPNVVLETTLMGVPNVATAVGGTVDCIKDEITGKMIPPGDPHIMAEAITELLSNNVLRQNYAEKGVEFINQNFDFNTRMERISNIYSNLF